MFCRHCGYEQDGGRFCDRCGKPIYMPRPNGAAQSYEPPQNDFDGGYYDDGYQNAPGAVIGQYTDGYGDDGYSGEEYFPDSYGDSGYNDGGYQEPYYTEDYYDGGYPDDAPPQRSHRSSGGRAASSFKKSNVFIIIACVIICAVGIFLIWTVFKLMTGKDKNGSGSFVTTTTAAKKTAKPEVTTAPAKTTTAAEDKPAPKTAEVIPASELAGMSIDQIRNSVGGDYRVSWDEYALADGTYFRGITSDSCFPDVLVVYTEDEFDDDDELLAAFENSYGDGVEIIVMNGGLIGDGVKVGDSYRDMITKANCLGAVDPSSGGSAAIIGGRLCYLEFDGSEDLSYVQSKYGSPVADAFGTDYTCTYAVFSDSFAFGDSIEGTVTANSVALRVAPYADSSNLWNLNTGERIKVDRASRIIESDGSTWYRVNEYRTDNGVWKHGYIHAEYVSLDQ